ncbi:Imm1 family immunity protein [Actinomycetes bacterium KLBMP 9797]
MTNGNGYDLPIGSEGDLIRGLAEVDKLARDEGRPRVVVLASDIDAGDAPYLSIGVGSDDSVLVYEAGDGEGGGYSKGPRTGDRTPVTFAYGTAPTEYLAWMLIPKAVAFEAARQFHRTGAQPTNVEWDDI